MVEGGFIGEGGEIEGGAGGEDGDLLRKVAVVGIVEAI